MQTKRREPDISFLQGLGFWEDRVPLCGCVYARTSAHWVHEQQRSSECCQLPCQGIYSTPKRSFKAVAEDGGPEGRLSQKLVIDVAGVVGCLRCRCIVPAGPLLCMCRCRSDRVGGGKKCCAMHITP